MAENSKTEKQSEQVKVLRKYLPEEFVEEVYELITEFPLDFKIVRPRKTKLGDFRYGGKLKRPQITINGNLNPYQFLVTTIHELAHFHAYRIYGYRIKAHGKEWKQTYRDLSLPIIDSKVLPSALENAWLDSLVSVKESSCADPKLYRVMRDLGPVDNTLVLLENIPMGSHFFLQGKEFVKNSIRRKRYLCTKVQNGKQYLVSPIAEVQTK